MYSTNIFKNYLLAVIMLLICNTELFSQHVLYSTVDSLWIEEILMKRKSDRNAPINDLITECAMEFIPHPYVAGVLDEPNEEKPVINIRELDCMTFVEQLVALALTIKTDKSDFSSFCKNLITLRYRNGVCRDYTDRLHYFSQWVDENSKKGILCEVRVNNFYKERRLNLHFMSRNSKNYKHLANDSLRIARINQLETPLRNINIKYLPKEYLHLPSNKIQVRNGDIVALVTNIEGLDVTHLGIAIWENKKLHFIHASQKAKAVCIDSLSLFDYMKNSKSALGIRVVRINNK